MKVDLRQIPAGSIVSCKSKGFSLFGFLQLWWARIKEGVAGCATHTALYVGGGKNYIIEAAASGVRKHKLTAYVGKERYQVDVFFKPDLTVLQVEKIKSYAYSKLGRRYDFMGVMRFLFRRLPQSPHRFFCSELVCESCRAGDWKVVPQMKCCDVSPSVIESWCRRNKDVELVWTQA